MSGSSRGPAAARNNNHRQPLVFPKRNDAGLLDVSKYQPSSAFTEQYGNFEDTAAIDLYQKLLHETDPARQRAVMREFEKHTLDDQVHNIPTLWVVSDRAAPLLCQRLEDQPEPLR